MELRHLRYFVAVAEELHFGHAARRLGMAQPPLSQQIQRLEADLEVTLFERTRRKVALTDAGRVFLDEARATLARAERAERVVREAARGAAGRLTVAFVGSATVHDEFVSIVRTFREGAPRVELVFEQMPTAHQVQALSDGTIDAGFLRPPVHLVGPPISVIPIVRERFVIVLPAEHPLATKRRVSIRALAKEPFVLFTRERGPGLYDEITTLCRSAGFVPQIRQHVSPMQTVAGLVAAGFGVSIMPDSIRRYAQSGVVYRDVPTATSMGIALAWRADLKIAPVLAAFVRVGRELTRNRAARDAAARR